MGRPSVANTLFWGIWWQWRQYICFHISRVKQCICKFLSPKKLLKKRQRFHSKNKANVNKSYNLENDKLPEIQTQYLRPNCMKPAKDVKRIFFHYFELKINVLPKDIPQFFFLRISNVSELCKIPFCLASCYRHKISTSASKVILFLGRGWRVCLVNIVHSGIILCKIA